MNENDDIMLPEGWDGKSDIFADTPEETTAPAAETPPEDNADGAPTTEPAAPTTGQTPPAAETEETKAESLAPTTGQSQPEPAPSETTPQQEGGKLRFTAKVDREDRDVELDPAELPGLYQKAQVTDRVQQRLQQLQPKVEKAEQLARTLGYSSLDDMVAKAEQRFVDSEVARLVSEGTPRGLAEYVAKQNAKEAKAAAAAPEAHQDQGPAEAPAGARDFVGEMEALRRVYPDAGKSGHLPDEVVNAAARDGVPLVAAYAAWDARQKAAEAERLRKENDVLRQNQQNQQKAPVVGVSAGGDTNQKPMDDFLRGFGE